VTVVVVEEAKKLLNKSEEEVMEEKRQKKMRKWKRMMERRKKTKTNPNLAVVTILADKWFNEKTALYGNHSLAELHMDNKRAFKKEVNFTLHRCEEEIPEKLKKPFQDHFNKERCLLHYLKNSPKHIDWLLWVDGDTWFYNPETRPLDFIDIARKRYRKGGRLARNWPYIIMAADDRAINAGVIFVKVHKWSISFFEDVLSRGRNIYSDQYAIIHAMKDRNDTDKSRIMIVPFDDQYKVQTYNPVFIDWLVHTPNCRAKGDNNCRRVQLMHYCLNPFKPKFSNLLQRCKDLKRKLAFSHASAWMHGGMFGWFLYLNPTWSPARMFGADMNRSGFTHWDQRHGTFEEGQPHINPPW